MATKGASATTGSVENNAKEALRLTKDYVHHFWARDFDWCLSRSASNLVWIGPQKGYYTTTIEEFSDLLTSVGTALLRSTVTDEEYTLISSDEHLCVVVSKFLALTPPSSDQIVAKWVVEKECVALRHRRYGALGPSLPDYLSGGKPQAHHGALHDQDHCGARRNT